MGRSRIILLLLALLAVVLLPGARIVPPLSTGAAACTAASYAAIEDIPVPAPGVLCTAEDTGRVWRYSAISALWFPPDVAPAALLLSYDGSALPSASVPVWTSDGAESAVPDAGMLRITDASGVGYRRFYYADAVNLVEANNLAFIVRMRVTAQDATAERGWRAHIGLRAGSTQPGAMFTIAAGSAVDSADSTCPMNSSGTGVCVAGVGERPDISPASGTLRTYYLLWRSATQTYEFGTLDGSAPLYALNRQLFLTTSDQVANGLMIGSYSGAGTATIEIDWMQAFIW